MGQTGKGGGGSQLSFPSLSTISGQQIMSQHWTSVPRSVKGISKERAGVLT